MQNLKKNKREVLNKGIVLVFGNGSLKFKEFLPQ